MKIPYFKAVVNTVKVQTQKGIIYVHGTVLTVQFLPSGEHKNSDLLLTSNSANIYTKHIELSYHVEPFCILMCKTSNYLVGLHNFFVPCHTPPKFAYILL